MSFHGLVPVVPPTARTRKPSVQRALHDIWEHTATAWLVGDYLLMPDHLRLFCAPRDLKFTIERWMGFWKDRFTPAPERSR